MKFNQTCIDQEQNSNRLAPVNIDYARETLFNLKKEAWNENVVNFSKLRTYTRFKQEYVAESYVHNVFNRAYRSIFAQFHSGISRYLDIPPQYRLYIFCDLNFIECEEHFLFHCPFYVNERTTFFLR